MKPKEKATELLVKQCALIAVDEILEFLKPFNTNSITKKNVKYWEEVKQEIEKL